MMRSIFIGTILGTLGIGGAAIAQDAFSPRPVQGIGADSVPVAPGLRGNAPNQRAVPGVPGAANKRGPAGLSGASPPGKKGKRGSITWPDGVQPRVMIMHHQIVEELELTPKQSKALQALMLEKAEDFKARQAGNRAGKGKGRSPKAGKGKGKRPMAGDGAERPDRPAFAAGERPTPPGR